ncbi:MAG: hypothetical protein FWF80_03075 [Defluviitaleaceae bacterium]|nr:hypothetical protein [Defluviitaleaceae bacterium]
MHLGFLCDCRFRYENRFGPFNERNSEEEFDEFRFRHHPMFYRFHRYIPRRRLWGALGVR